MLRVFMGLSLALALSHAQEPPQSPTSQTAGERPRPVESSSPTNQQYEVPLGSDIRLTFVEPMLPNTIERSLSFFPARYASHDNPVTFIPLTLTPVCGGVWQVTNPNEARISFTWITDDGAERGVGVAPAASSVTVSSLNHARTLRLCVNGQLQAEEPPDERECNQPRGSFAWTDAKKTLTYTPTTPVQENTDYTLVLSTGAAIQGGAELARPYVLQFSSKRDLFPGLTADMVATRFQEAYAALNAVERELVAQGRIQFNGYEFSVVPSLPRPPSAPAVQPAAPTPSSTQDACSIN